MAGTWDELDGERDRVAVTLATDIPEDATRSIHPRLPRDDRPHRDPDTLVVRDAGEDLYRLR